MTLLITGVSKGLGHALAVAAISRGLPVAGVVRSPYTDSAKVLAELGMRVFSADLSQPLAVEDLAKQLSDAGVVPRVVVLNAASMADDFEDRLDADVLQTVIGTNLVSPLLLISHLLPAMASNKGLIIAISSLSARLATDPRRIAYPASKAGLSMALSALRLRRDLDSIQFVTVEVGRMSSEALPLAITYEAAAQRILALADDPDPPATLAFPVSAVLVFHILRLAPNRCLRWIANRRSQARVTASGKTFS